MPDSTTKFPIDQSPNNGVAAEGGEASNPKDGAVVVVRAPLPSVFPPPSEDDFAPSPERDRGPLSVVPPRGRVWPAVAFLVISTAATWAHWTHLADLGATRAQVFAAGEYWRLFTAITVHSGLGHLASNSLFLVIFGFLLNAYFGGLVFPGLSLLLGVVTHALTLATYPDDVELVGCSGMVYAMVGLWLVLYIRHARDPSIPMRLMRATAFLLGVMAPTTFERTTSYSAHAIGLALGLVAGLILQGGLSIIDYRDTVNKG